MRTILLCLIMLMAGLGPLAQASAAASCPVGANAVLQDCCDREGHNCLTPAMVCAAACAPALLPDVRHPISAALSRAAHDVAATAAIAGQETRPPLPPP